MLGSFFNLKGKLALSIMLWYLCLEASLRPQGLDVLSNVHCLPFIWSWPALYWDACCLLKKTTYFRKMRFDLWGLGSEGLSTFLVLLTYVLVW